MSPTIDITCEYCAVQRHESNVWRKVENNEDLTRREVWCCNECWVCGEETEKEMCEEMGEEFTGQNTKVLEIINDAEETQDDFTNRVCGACGEGFDLADPHYYDEEEGECYCNEKCFKESNDDNFTCDKCNCVKDREFHVSLNGDDSGNTICEECIDDYIAERVRDARRLVQAELEDEEEEFVDGEYGVRMFKSKTRGWLYAEPYCFNCGHRACDGDCTCDEDEMDWREAEYEAE
jgi:hypothetical protein